MNILNKIKSKQSKQTVTSEPETKSQTLLNNIKQHQHNQDKTPEHIVSDQIGSKHKHSKSVSKLLNKVRQNLQQNNSIDQHHKQEQKLSQSKKQIVHVRQEKLVNKKQANKVEQQKLANQRQKLKVRQERLSKSKDHKYENLQKKSEQSKQKSKKSSVGDLRPSSRQIGSFDESNRISQKTESRLSDLSDQALPVFGDSLTKINKIQKSFNWTHPSLKNLPDPPTSLHKSPIPPSPPPVPPRHQFPPNIAPSSYSHILHIKKGYQIGRMSILQGTLQVKKVQSKSNIKYQIRTRDTEIIKLSCKLDLINNPESVALLYLKDIVQVGDKEYLVNGDGLIRVVEKPGNKR